MKRGKRAAGLDYAFGCLAVRGFPSTFVHPPFSFV